MRNSPLAFIALAALALGALAACSDSNSNDTTPTPSASAASSTSTAAPTVTPAPSPTVAPSPTPVSVAQRLAKTAGYFVYKVRAGDDIGTIAGLFNGEPGSAKAGYPQQILDVNGVTSTGLTAGLELAIPLLNTPGDIIPSAGLAGAFDRATGTKLTVMEPSAALRSAYGDSVALHAVEIVATASPGYRMEYWLTSTPFSTGSTLNREAMVVTPLMVVTAGSMVPANQSTDTARFDRSGVTYALTVLAGAKASAADLALMLQPPAAAP